MKIGCKLRLKINYICKSEKNDIHLYVFSLLFRGFAGKISQYHFITLCNKQIVVMKKFFRTVLAFCVMGGMLTFTGCTDFQDDINSLNDRLDALETGELASVSEQVKSLEEALNQANQTIDGLSGSVADLSGSLTDLSGDVEAMNGRLDGLDGTVGDLSNTVNDINERLEAVEALADALDALEAEVAAIEAGLADYATKDDVAATYATIEAVNALTSRVATIEASLKSFEDDMADFEARLGGLEDQCDALAGKDAELDSAIKAVEESVAEVKAVAESAVKAAAAAQATADKALETAQSALGEIATIKEALKTYATKAELAAAVEALEAKVDEDVAALKAELLEQMEAQAEEFDAKLAEAVKSAIEENNGVVDQKIASAIASATETFNKSLAAVQARVDALVNKVEDLANRIQSLVFVPEYDDFAATSFAYRINNYVLSENQTVYATFQVTPMELAAQVAAQTENVFLYVQPMKTRAAGEAVTVTGEDLVLTADPATGRVEVEATFSRDIQNYSIALYVADAKVVEDAEANADIEGIDAGSYISSAYVPVVESPESQLVDNFRLYNFETEKEYGASKEFEESWKDAPAPVDFYEGYEVAIKYEGEYLTIAEAAELFNVAVEELTPAYVHEEIYYEYDEASDSYTGRKPAKTDGISVADKENGYGVIASMVENPEDAKEFIHDCIVVENRFAYAYGNSVNGPADLITNTTSYKITNQKYEIELGTKNVDWTYALAVELADGGYVPNVLPYEFREVSVVNYDELKAEYENIREIITHDNVEVTTEVTLNGRPAALDVEIEALAVEEAHIATVTVEGYDFAQGEDNTYNVQQRFTIPEDGNEVVFNFTFTLGAMPEDQDIALGSYDLPFIGSGYDEIELDVDPYETVYGRVSSDFEDLDEFLASLNHAKSNVMETVYNGKDSSRRDWTHLQIDGEKPYEAHIRYSSSDIQKFGDEFEFTTTVETWYGVTYTFTADGTVESPVYSLAYDEAIAPTKVVYIDGILENGVYAFPTVELNNYFYVKNPDGISDNLTVKFEPVTKVDDKAGIVNLPVYSATEASVDASGKLAETTLDWSSYTALSYQLEAVLYVTIDNTNKEIEVSRLPLTIETDCPIVSFGLDASDETNIDRKAGEDCTINLWEYVDVRGILDSSENLAEWYNTTEKAYVEYSSLDELNNGRNFGTYQAELKFAPVDELYTNGTVHYDPATGVVVFDKDNGVLQNNVVISVEATLEYYLDYNHVQAKSFDIEVTLMKER